jgi:hypothetical protein
VVVRARGGRWSSEKISEWAVIREFYRASGTRSRRIQELDPIAKPDYANIADDPGFVDD